MGLLECHAVTQKSGKAFVHMMPSPPRPRLPRPLPLVKYLATRRQRSRRQRTHRSSSLRIAPTLYCVRIIWSIRKAPPLPSPKARCSARSACPQRSGTLDSGLSRHRTGQPRLSSKQSVTPPRTDRRSIHTHTQGTHSELQFHSHFSIIQLASGILPFPSSNTPSFHLFFSRPPPFFRPLFFNNRRRTRAGSEVCCQLIPSPKGPTWGRKRWGKSGSCHTPLGLSTTPLDEIAGVDADADRLFRCLNKTQTRVGSPTKS